MPPDARPRVDPAAPDALASDLVAGHGQMANVTRTRGGVRGLKKKCT